MHLFCFFTVVLFLATLLASPESLKAADTPFSLRSDSILRAYERPDADGDSTLLFPAYEILGIDYGIPGEKGFSGHLYGWGRHDMAGSDFFKKQTDFELIYGYVNYTFLRDGPALSIGRQAVFTGMTDEHLDGLRLTTPMSRWFTLTAYGGIPYADGPENDRRDQRVYGGRLAFQPNPSSGLAFNYQTVTGTDPENDEKLAVDFFTSLPLRSRFTGYSSWNAVSGRWAEHAYALSLPVADFTIHPLYERYNYSDLFGEGSPKANPFRYLATTDDTLSIYGGDVYWQNAYRPFEIGVEFKHYSNSEAEATADYASGLFNWTGNDTALFGVEVGRMAGEAEENRFLLYRIYAASPAFDLFNRSGHFTGEAMYIDYDAPIYGEAHSLYLSLSCICRLFEHTEMVLSADYTQGPYFDSDISGTLVIRYAIGNLFSGDYE